MKFTKRITLSLLFCSIFSITSEALDLTDRYRVCLKLAKTDSKRGFEIAMNWLKSDGGVASRHCAAVAILFMGNYGKAAFQLERLEKEVADNRFYLRSQILSQAGQAWFLAGKLERSVDAHSASILLYSQDPQSYMDRAASQIERRQYQLALIDLNEAIRLDPELGDAYLYRATVKRYMDNLSGALVDIDRTLELIPDLPAAILERGILKELQKDFLGARKDWENILRNKPETYEADISRARLNKLKNKDRK